jgi:hypothetical protein
MNSSGTHSKRSRGWWRLWAGILFIATGTLGLGFYAPLYKTHQILKQELAASRSSATQLTESLTRAEASVQRVTAERSELSSFKDEVDTKHQRFPKLAERFSADASSAFKAALGAKDVRMVPLEDGVGLDWTSPAVLNRQRDALNAAGQKLLCSPIKQANELGLSELTVRTFTALDAVPKDLEASYAAGTTLAVGVTKQHASSCSVSMARVTVATSPASKDTPILRFEFRARHDQTQPRL